MASKTLESPIIYNQSDDKELTSKFAQLLHATIIISESSLRGSSGGVEDRAAYDDLYELIRIEVVAKPCLSKVVHANSSLLKVACHIDQDCIHPVIKILIETNPSALLWKSTNDSDRSPLSIIAGHQSHCILMPWIAQNYPWILDQDETLKCPPVFRLINQYGLGMQISQCSVKTIRSFFEAYPKGLCRMNSLMETPLHAMAREGHGCDADLFIWLVQRYPVSMYGRDHFGLTPLHRLCLNIRMDKDDLRKICMFLIAEHPVIVRVVSNKGVLPIHFLVGRCHNQLVLETAMKFLHEYPESFDLAPECQHLCAPSKDPFIHHAYLQETLTAYQEAVSCTQDRLINNVCSVFSNWAFSHLKDLEAKMEQDTKNNFG